MNILYTNSSKQIHQLQLDFEKLEQGEDTSSAIQGILMKLTYIYIINILEMENGLFKIKCFRFRIFFKKK